jgi:hypothetical protein
MPVTLCRGAGLSITAPIALFRFARSMYHGPAVYCLFDPHPLKRPANRPSFNEAFNLLSRGQRWLAIIPWAGMVAFHVRFDRFPNFIGRSRML